MEDTDILTLLQQQLDNFPNLKTFISTRRITPAIVFLPQILKDIDTELSNRTELVIDCLNFLDIVNFYSLLLYSDTNVFLNKINSLFISNRTVYNINNTLGKSNIDDFIFTSDEEANKFIHSNKLVLSIYIFSLVSLIFYQPN